MLMLSHHGSPVLLPDAMLMSVGSGAMGGGGAY